MKSKYPKEYSNLKKKWTSNENQTCRLQMKLCDIWRVLRPGKYDFDMLICVLTMTNYGLTEDFMLI